MMKMPHADAFREAPSRQRQSTVKVLRSVVVSCERCARSQRCDARGALTPIGRERRCWSMSLADSSTGVNPAHSFLAGVNEARIFPANTLEWLMIFGPPNRRTPDDKLETSPRWLSARIERRHVSRALQVLVVLVLLAALIYRRIIR